MINKEKAFNLDPKISYTVANLDSIYGRDFIPHNQPGIKLLDLGAGQSSIVAELRLKGVIAYALDPGYAVPVELNRYTDRQLKKGKKRKDKNHQNADVQTKRTFLADFATNSGNYIAAKTTQLPFQNDTFDFVLSNFCINPMISSRYPNELIPSVQEVLRVLKPGGRALISPFDATEDAYEKKFKEAELHSRRLNSVLEVINGEGYTYELYQFAFPLTVPKELRQRYMLLIDKKQRI